MLLIISIYGRRRQGHYILPLIISIDERPAMGSQPNLVSKSEVVSIYKCPIKISGDSPPHKFGVQKHQLLDHFFCDFRTRHRISPEQNVAWTNKNASVNLPRVPYKLTYFSRTFDLEMAEIRLLIVTQHSAAIALLPSKLRHLYSLLCFSSF